MMEKIYDKQFQKAIFLDRDGTINIEKHYLYKIEEFEFAPGAIEGLQILQKAGYMFVVITNQSGIGRGYYSEGDFKRLNAWMLDELKNYGINIAKVYYCPHLPDAQIEKYQIECQCRKPELGMFYRACNELYIDIDHSYAIGDMLRDCAIAKSTNCKGILISDRENKDVINDIKKGKYKNIFYAKNLLEAAQFIVKE